MKRLLLSIVTASALLAGAGLASAQTATSSTTTTWTNDEGTTIREYSTEKKYNSVDDATMKPTVGMEVPSTVTLYPLPETMKVENPDQYSYVIINNHPVVVERTTRKVVHTWE